MQKPKVKLEIDIFRGLGRLYGLILYEKILQIFGTVDMHSKVYIILNHRHSRCPVPLFLYNISSFAHYNNCVKLKY